MVQEFINLRMSVQEFSLKFTKFSRYDPFLMSNTRDEMIRFIMSVFKSIEEERRVAMLCYNMDISGLMVYAQ